MVSSLSPHQTNEAWLLVSDLDSTLIQMETIDRLAGMVGKEAACAAITRQAMEGQLDFAAALRARVALLAGAVPDFASMEIPYTPGAHEFLPRLKAFLGPQRVLLSVIVSGGFTPLAERVRRDLGFDLAYANELETCCGGQLTGQLKPGSRLIDGAAKRDILSQLAQAHGIPPERIIAVGDGANDIPMLQAAGWSFAFMAKPRVRSSARFTIDVPNILFIIDRLEEEYFT